MYTIRALKTASRELGRLAKRVTARIHWLAQNLDNVKHQALKGELTGLYKLREGDYRVLYEIIRSENLIIIHSIGHRREIYQKK